MHVESKGVIAVDACGIETRDWKYLAGLAPSGVFNSIRGPRVNACCRGKHSA